MYALTDALRRLLTDSELRGRLQAGARRAAAHLPTWSQTGATVARLIEDVKTA